MKHPAKWRETVDPYSLKFNCFSIKEVIGYPHAGNDVFQVIGIYDNSETEAYIKVGRQYGADIKNEIEIIRKLQFSLAPEILDYDHENYTFEVSRGKAGERLSTIVGDNADFQSLDYLYEYGQKLAEMHNIEGKFSTVKDRRFFHIPDRQYFAELKLEYVYDWLIKNTPERINSCFCHGDFHYANILWKEKHISAILDYELSGWGNKEFDIAWAIILRPGQQFLKTEEEKELFLKGYSSVGSYNKELVDYYMILIYSYFYQIGKSDKEYQEYITKEFEKHCK